jgi:Bifunctional DNA primase/polymerase, N-terminal
MEQGATLELDGNVLRVVPRNDIYTRYLNANCAVIGDLATQRYGRAIEAVLQCGPNSGATGNGSNPAVGTHRTDEAEAAKVPSAGADEKSAPTPNRELKPLSCAIAYARHGIKVFPIYEIEADRQCSCGKLECPSGGKHPRLKDWQTLATTDEDQIKRWWREWPRQRWREMRPR